MLQGSWTTDFVQEMDGIVGTSNTKAAARHLKGGNAHRSSSSKRQVSSCGSVECMKGAAQPVTPAEKAAGKYLSPLSPALQPGDDFLRALLSKSRYNVLHVAYDEGSVPLWRALLRICAAGVQASSM